MQAAEEGHPVVGGGVAFGSVSYWADVHNVSMLHEFHVSTPGGAAAFSAELELAGPPGCDRPRGIDGRSPASGTGPGMDGTNARRGCPLVVRAAGGRGPLPGAPARLALARLLGDGASQLPGAHGVRRAERPSSLAGCALAVASAFAGHCGCGHFSHFRSKRSVDPVPGDRRRESGSPNWHGASAQPLRRADPLSRNLS